MKVYVWSKTGKLIMKEENALDYNIKLAADEAPCIYGNITTSSGTHEILMTEGIVTTFKGNDE